MIVFIIIILILLFIFGIVFSIIFHVKKSERQKYYVAAGNILREEFLNYALQNTISPEHNIAEPKTAKMMIYLKSKCGGKKNRFVFDPEKPINIGRGSNNINIYINDMSVSQNHCRIYSQGNSIFLQDVDSANGTVLERGPFKRYFLSNRNQIELKSKDKIIISSNEFRVTIFYFDLATM